MSTDKFDFRIDDTGPGSPILRWDSGGCRPAYPTEIAMWKRIDAYAEALQAIVDKKRSSKLKDVEAIYQIATKALGIRSGAVGEKS